MDRENTANETWNKKRIFIAIFLIILLIVGVYFFKTEILGEKINLFTSKNSESSKSIKGVNVKENEPSLNIKKALKEKIEEIRQEASKLDVADIASSSPQVQKILNDIKGLEQYPKNQLQDICKKVCGL